LRRAEAGNIAQRLFHGGWAFLVIAGQSMIPLEMGLEMKSAGTSETASFHVREGL
jgi:hypothetical protein